MPPSIMPNTRQKHCAVSKLVAMLSFDQPPTAAADLLQNNARESLQSFTDAICSGQSDFHLRCEVDMDVPSKCDGAVVEPLTCPIVLYLHS